MPQRSNTSPTSRSSASGVTRRSVEKAGVMWPPGLKVEWGLSRALSPDALARDAGHDVAVAGGHPVALGWEVVADEALVRRGVDSRLDARPAPNLGPHHLAQAGQVREVPLQRRAHGRGAAHDRAVARHED